jgi:hypothetical protein
MTGEIEVVANCDHLIDMQQRPPLPIARVKPYCFGFGGMLYEVVEGLHDSFYSIVML